MIILIQLVGPSSLKFRMAKTSKIWRDFGQRQNLIANISTTDNAIDKPYIRRYQSQSLLLSTEKYSELSFTNHRVYAANICPPIINSTRDFGQLYTLIAKFSGTD